MLMLMLMLVPMPVLMLMLMLVPMPMLMLMLMLVPMPMLMLAPPSQTKLPADRSLRMDRCLLDDSACHAVQSVTPPLLPPPKAPRQRASALVLPTQSFATRQAAAP
eukprot:1578638-Pleurochrysis_carterae.AAC.1